jgi:predicted phosphodiesterase
MAARTLFLVVSDTHRQWPFTNSHPAPPADVFLHYGDLTLVGGLASLKRAFDDIKTIDAPLKLVIAGNHDLELDEEWVHKNMEGEEDLEESKTCLDSVKSQKVERVCMTFS